MSFELVSDYLLESVFALRSLQSRNLTLHTEVVPQLLHNIISNIYLSHYFFFFFFIHFLITYVDIIAKRFDDKTISLRTIKDKVVRACVFFHEFTIKSKEKRNHEKKTNHFATRQMAITTRDAIRLRVENVRIHVCILVHTFRLRTLYN